jgi:hypothetical protein
MGRPSSRPTQNFFGELTLNACLPQPGHPIAFFPLTALLQDFDALKALQNVPLRTQSARTS